MIISPAPLTVSPVCHDLENFLPAPRESLLRALAGQLRTSTRAALVSALSEPTPPSDPGAWHHRADPLG